MRFSARIGIAAATVWLPETVQTTAEAISLGKLEPDEVAGTGVRQVPVSADVSAPDLAVRAGVQALREAAIPACRLNLLVHAWIYHQGHDFWSPAHYVADRLGAGEALPIGLNQMCNGGAAGLLTAVTRVLAELDPVETLVTTADRFTSPGFDRWQSDYAVAYGDGATAAVVHRCVPGRDQLDLLSLATMAAPALENMHRGDDAFSPAPRWHSSQIDVRRTKKAFLAAGGTDLFRETAQGKVRQVLTRALAEAGVAADDPRLRLVLLPRLGPNTLELMYLPVIEDMVKAEALALGEDTGHLGAGDFLANLAELTMPGRLDAGDLALVVGGGGGFSWTCAVVQRPLRRFRP
jgi:3-oxoacyl-[acyl-carrier-protein] synthase III